MTLTKLVSWLSYITTNGAGRYRRTMSSSARRSSANGERRELDVTAR